MKKLISFIGIGALGTLAGCSTMTPTDDPLYLRQQDLEARLIRIERVFENQSLIELASSLDQLRTQTQELRGQIETLRFETENGATRQRELYLDVDTRLQALEQSQPRASLGPSPATRGFPADRPAAGGQLGAAPARPSGSDQQNYQAAFELIQARRYEEAERAFRDFLSGFPNSPLTDNAQYWLAETHYVQRDFAGALPEFQKVIDSYPQSAKIPDALLKVGYCQYELNDFEAARAALESVTRQYPDTTAARLAAQRLERLQQEGA
jgi:tol-pal system protein YbgF